MKKSTIAGILSIVIDVFNLAEQFGIYFIAKQTPLDETTQQRFFFILFGIGGATMIRPMFLWSKLKVIFSILIEIGEFIAYLILLPRTTELIIVATVFFALEIILHCITFYGTKSNLDEIKSDAGIFLRDFCCFPIRILLYGLIYSSPILFLFLNPESKFRDTFYENLLILNVFFGAIYIDMIIAPCCMSDSKTSPEEIIYLVWQRIAYIIYNILALIIMITTLVFAGQAIQKHATGVEILSQYDYGVSIYCLVNYGLLALGQVMNCCNVCLRCMTQQQLNK